MHSFYEVAGPFTHQTEGRGERGPPFRHRFYQRTRAIGLVFLVVLVVALTTP